MQTATTRWLDRLAKLHGQGDAPASDYRLSKLLGVRQTVISKYRLHGQQMDDAIALRLAELLKVHPRIVIAEVMAERARDERAKRYWAAEAKSAAKKLAVAGAAILAAVSGPSLSEAARQLCILCKAARASNDDDFHAPARLPSYKRGRIVTLNERAA